MKISIFLLLTCFVSLILFSSCSVEEVESERSVSSQYALTVTASEGGSVLPEATGIYDQGATMTLSAIPDEGYEFIRWSGSDNDNGRCGIVTRPTKGYCRAIVTIYSNRDIYAYFQIKSE
ncbi:MAG: hypothetical protein P8I42_02630 [Flavobacteriaceae bacterium]|jgi:hypothetical protein|nr:hypothetical protein [Flavobacteriaceae bacterium]MDG1911702.1 hypothetical protein [Flavobacteriaceae bacterium]